MRYVPVVSVHHTQEPQLRRGRSFNAALAFSVVRFCFNLTFKAKNKQRIVTLLFRSEVINCFIRVKWNFISVTQTIYTNEVTQMKFSTKNLINYVIEYSRRYEKTTKCPAYLLLIYMYNKEFTVQTLTSTLLLTRMINFLY